MSKDFKLKHTCPHFVMGEWLAIGQDRRTLTPVTDPSSTQTVELFVNGHRIPKQGLYSDVSVRSQKGQPYTFPEDQNEFTLSVNNGPSQTVSFEENKPLSGQHVSQRLSRQVEGVDASIDDMGHLVLSVSQSVGRQESLFLRGGSGHPSLGLKDRRYYQNKKVTPGWEWIERTTLQGQQRKAVRFEEPLRSTEDIIELSYYTRQSDCRRCQGQGIEDDIRFDRRGDPVFVEDEELLLQEVQKVTFTVKGTNVFYQWYGTSLMDAIGTKVLPGGDVLEEELTSEIVNALNRYRDVKQQQSSIQPVSDEEFLLRINTIQVEQGADPTVFNVDIDIQNRDRSTQTISKKIVVSDDQVKRPDSSSFRPVSDRN
jgi:hypothetical protein